MIKYLLIPLAFGGLLLLSVLFAPVSIYLNQFKSLISPYQFEYSYAEGTILDSNIEDVYLNEYDLGTFKLSSSFTLTDLELLISTTDKFIGSAKILFPFASIAKARFNVQEAEINYLYKTSELGEFTITTTIDNALFVSAQCVEIEGAIIILNESFRDSLLGIINCDKGIYFAELFNNSNDYIGKITLIDNAFDINISTSIFKSRRARLLGDSIGFKIPLE
ncbi:MAG: hypothetical protein ACJ0GI_01490 [Gammaproteobacteria bacterium]|tara:strand:- start:795 stop:1457 length:663 start_codon:yes stop_codon:yes gene_type:complete